MSEEMDLSSLLRNYDLPVEISTSEELNQLLLLLIKYNGSEVYIDGGDFIFFQIHSRNYQVGERRITVSEASVILSLINGEEAVAKINSGDPDNPSYDIEEVGMDESGEKKLLRHRFRVNAVLVKKRGRRAACITMRSIVHTPPHYNDIGISKDEIVKFTSIGHGLGLVIGPTGSGKTTLLAAITRELLSIKDNIVNTLEDPIEYAYDSVPTNNSRIRQMEIGVGIQDFSKGVVNCMRMKPSHIIIGESRDYETISAAAESALTGHGVLTTVHAGKISEAIDRMIMRYPASLRDQAKLDLVSVLKFAVAQRLVKSADGKRIAVREKLFLTDDIRKKILKSERIAETVEEVVESFGISFRRDIEEKFQHSLITKEVRDQIMFEMYGVIYE